MLHIVLGGHPTVGSHNAKLTLGIEPNGIIDVSVGRVASRCDAEPLARFFFWVTVTQKGTTL